MNQRIKDFLDEKVALFNRPNFIELDPISIPHRFAKKQDIEIAGFFAAILAWGQRKTILNKCNELLETLIGLILKVSVLRSTSMGAIIILTGAADRLRSTIIVEAGH